MVTMTDPKYFKPGGPADPLRVEPGRAVVDRMRQIWFTAARDPGGGEYGPPPSPANVDTFVHELVGRYNQHPKLVELICTVLREISPVSVAALKYTDLARLHAHVMGVVRELAIDVTATGKPAVLVIPPMPEDPSSASDPDALWAEGWLAGYNAAWIPAIPADTNEPKDTGT